MRLPITKKVIYGCESGHNGGRQSPYLTRYTLLQTRRGQLCLHMFHRSDADVPHDHPWDFWTLVLWRGYWEYVQLSTGLPWMRNDRRLVWPLQFLFRTAEHTHRVELFRNDNGAELPAVTLVWMGRRRREWGFHEASGFVAWRTFFAREGC